MKTSRFVCAVAVAAAGILFGASACTTEPIDRGHPTYALAVTVQGLPPNPTQWETVRAKIAPTIPTSWTFVNDTRRADRVIQVNFIPDAADPDHEGKVFVMGIVPRNRTRIYSSAPSSRTTAMQYVFEPPNPIYYRYPYDYDSRFGLDPYGYPYPPYYYHGGGRSRSGSSSSGSNHSDAGGDTKIPIGPPHRFEKPSLVDPPEHHRRVLPSSDDTPPYTPPSYPTPSTADSSSSYSPPPSYTPPPPSSSPPPTYTAPEPSYSPPAPAYTPPETPRYSPDEGRRPDK